MTITISIENLILASMVAYPIFVGLIMWTVKRDRLDAFGYFYDDFRGWGWALIATPVVWLFGFAALYVLTRLGGAA